MKYSIKIPLHKLLALLHSEIRITNPTSKNNISDKSVKIVGIPVITKYKVGYLINDK